MSDPKATGEQAADPTAEKQTPQQIEADIARQREELAHTVDALGAKLDVKSRAQDKAAELKDRATTDAGKPRTDLTAGAVVAVLALAGLVVWRRRSR